MTGELQFLATITLIFLLAIFAIANKPKPEPQEQKPKKSQKTPTNQAPKSSDIIDSLDWMLAHSIITPQEYSKLMGKCLPFIQ